MKHVLKIFSSTQAVVGQTLSSAVSGINLVWPSMPLVTLNVTLCSRGVSAPFCMRRGAQALLLREENQCGLEEMAQAY